jgi:hypothetical protein
VRALDLASGGLECSLVGLRAGSTDAAPRVPGGGEKVPKVVVHGGVPPSELFYSQTMASREFWGAPPLVLAVFTNVAEGEIPEVR